MQKVKNKFELLSVSPTSKYVLIESIDKIFQYDNGEWMEKAYFTVHEIAEITGMTTDKVHQFIDKMGLRAKTARRSKFIRLNLRQLRVIFFTKKMRNLNVPFKTIRHNYEKNNPNRTV